MSVAELLRGVEGAAAEGAAADLQAALAGALGRCGTGDGTRSARGSETADRCGAESALGRLKAGMATKEFSKPDAARRPR
jgi:hypothetical protein